MKRRLLLAATAVILAAAVCHPATARADLCPYPGVGEAASVLFGRGGFCDYPTEIGGQHMHCEAGGAGLGGSAGLAGVGDLGTASLGLGGFGAGGASCTWRCPDGVLAPPPNPPGAWKNYLVPMPDSFCGQGHMEPNGFWSMPTPATEGIPPEGFTPPQAVIVAPEPPALNEPPGMPTTIGQ